MRQPIRGVNLWKLPQSTSALNCPQLRIVDHLGYGGSWIRSFGTDPGTFLDRDDVTERMMMLIKNFEKVDAAKVNEKSHFAKDLGLDSLDAVEVVMAMEEEFVIEIPDDIAEKILTMEDAINFIVAHPQAK